MIVDYRGICGAKCDCDINLWEPACGNDFHMYCNECMARCNTGGLADNRLCFPAFYRMVY